MGLALMLYRRFRRKADMQGCSRLARQLAWRGVAKLKPAACMRESWQK